MSSCWTLHSVYSMFGCTVQCTQGLFHENYLALFFKDQNCSLYFVTGILPTTIDTGTGTTSYIIILEHLNASSSLRKLKISNLGRGELVWPFKFWHGPCRLRNCRGADMASFLKKVADFVFFSGIVHFSSFLGGAVSKMDLNPSGSNLFADSDWPIRIWIRFMCWIRLHSLNSGSLIGVYRKLL